MMRCAFIKYQEIIMRKINVTFARARIQHAQCTLQKDTFATEIRFTRILPREIKNE